MLLAVDIGNTNVTFGVFEDGELHATWRLATDINQMADEYAAFLLNLLHYQNLETSDIKEVVLCCVVPPLLRPFEELFERYFHISPLVVGPGIKTGVNIRIDNPREVGTDRIVNTAAAHRHGFAFVMILKIFEQKGDAGKRPIGNGLRCGLLGAIKKSMNYRVDLRVHKFILCNSSLNALQWGYLAFCYELSKA